MGACITHIVQPSLHPAILSSAGHNCTQEDVLGQESAPCCMCIIFESGKQATSSEEGFTHGKCLLLLIVCACYEVGRAPALAAWRILKSHNPPWSFRGAPVICRPLVEHPPVHVKGLSELLPPYRQSSKVQTDWVLQFHGTKNGAPVAFDIPFNSLLEFKACEGAHSHLKSRFGSNLEQYKVI